MRVLTCCSARARLRTATSLLAAALASGALVAQDLERVGVGAGKLQLDLRQAILWAVERNPSIQLSRIQLTEREGELLSAKGAFDLTFHAGVDFLSDTAQVGSVLAGGDRGILSADTFTQTFDAQQQLGFGGRWTAFWDSSRQTTSNVFNSLDPYYPSLAGFRFELPLWRDFRVNAEQTTVTVSLSNLEGDRAELRRTVLDTVRDVRLTYWDLVKARQSVEVESEAVKLAQEQLELNRRLVRAGQAAEVDIEEARATLERRRQDLLSAVEGVANGENALKRLILAGRQDAGWNREIVPSNEGERGPAELNVDQAWQTAHDNRPELEALEKRSEAQQATSSYLANQTKPRIDLVASYQSNGLAGTPRSGSNPFQAGDEALQQRVNELSVLQGLEPLVFPTRAELPADLRGGLDRSLANLFSNDFRTVQVGVRVELPWSNRRAEGALSASLARENALKAERQALELRIEAEVRDSLQSVATARRRLQAARAARQATEQKLASETRRFSAGETTNFFVLTRQNEYLESRSREVQAEADLNRTIALLQHALGNGLEPFGIRIED